MVYTESCHHAKPIVDKYAISLQTSFIHFISILRSLINPQLKWDDGDKTRQLQEITRAMANSNGNGIDNEN